MASASRPSFLRNLLSRPYISITTLCTW